MLAGDDKADADSQRGGDDQKGAEIEQSAQGARVSHREESAGNAECSRDSGDATRPNQRGWDRGEVQCHLQKQCQQGEDSGVSVAGAVERDLGWR